MPTRDVEFRVIVKSGKAVVSTKRIEEGFEDIEDQVEKTDRQIGRMSGKSMANLRRYGTAALTAVAAAAGYALYQGVELAKNVTETSAKYETTLGPAIDKTNKFLDENATLMGLSRSEGEEMVATTAAIAQGMGYSQEASADFANELVKTAGDLTSFNNVPIERTSQAIQRALAGEREALKSLGIVINEEMVKQRAMKDFRLADADAMTQQMRAASTLTLIQEKAGVAMGDLVRTQDSAANRSRQVQAEIKNIAEQMSLRLIPAIHGGLEALAPFVDEMADWVRIDASDKVQDEQVALNTLVGQITNANTKQETRNQLIAELQTTYPEFLENLDAETVTNEELANRLADVNENYVARITLMQQEERIGEIVSEQSEARRQLVGVQIAATEAARKLNEEQNAGIKIANQSTGQILEQLEVHRKQQGMWFDSSVELDAMTHVYDFASRQIDIYNEKIGEEQDIMSGLIKQFPEMYQSMQNDRVVHTTASLEVQKQTLEGILQQLEKGTAGWEFYKDQLDQVNKKIEESGGGSGGKGITTLKDKIKALKDQYQSLTGSTSELTTQQREEAIAIQQTITKIEGEIAARQQQIDMIIRQRALAVRDQRNKQFGIQSGDVEADTSGLHESGLAGEDPRIAAEKSLQEQKWRTLEVSRSVHDIVTADTQSEIEQRNNLARAIGQNAAAAIQYADSVKGAIKGIIKGLINAIIANWVKNALQTAGASGPLALALSAPLAAGAMAAASALTKPLLDFRHGGLVQGRLHSEGGIRGVVGSTPFEFEGGEYIVNRESTKKNLGLLEAINQNGSSSPVMSAMSGDINILAQALRQGLESANIIAPVQLRRLDEEQNKERAIESFIGNETYG